MNLLEKLPKIETIPIGEVRMGCEAFGLIIKTAYGDFEIFKDMPILVGSENYQDRIEISSCNKYIKVLGSLGVYILNVQDQSVSIYKTTIHANVIDTRDFGEGTEWSEEQAIYGKVKTHINSFKNHFYLQFPFVKKEHFHSTLVNYEKLRIKQIKDAVNAL
ncbi:hypothetical protein [Pseudomonas leptonychotis]|uniref:hypothetical protein n=1 Tax=Pseudomonas leptonychotis TaxID=2448482 RepID=UPI0039F10EB7